jgi:hypothetical protein
MRMKIAQSKALVDTVKEFGPLRPRLLELRKRAKQLAELTADPTRTDIPKF